MTRINKQGKDQYPYFLLPANEKRADKALISVGRQTAEKESKRKREKKYEVK